MTNKEQQDLILSRLRDLDWELRRLNKKLDSVTAVLDKIVIAKMEGINV